MRTSGEVESQELATFFKFIVQKYRHLNNQCKKKA